MYFRDAEDFDQYFRRRLKTEKLAGLNPRRADLVQHVKSQIGLLLAEMINTQQLQFDVTRVADVGLLGLPDLCSVTYDQSSRMLILDTMGMSSMLFDRRENVMGVPNNAEFIPETELLAQLSDEARTALENMSPADAREVVRLAAQRAPQGRRVLSMNQPMQSRFANLPPVPPPIAVIPPVVPAAPSVPVPPVQHTASTPPPPPPTRGPVRMDFQRASQIAQESLRRRREMLAAQMGATPRDRGLSLDEFGQSLPQQGRRQATREEIEEQIELVTQQINRRLGQDADATQRVLAITSELASLGLLSPEEAATMRAAANGNRRSPRSQLAVELTRVQEELRRERGVEEIPTEEGDAIVTADGQRRPRGGRRARRVAEATPVLDTEAAPVEDPKPEPAKQRDYGRVLDLDDE